MRLIAAHEIVGLGAAPATRSEAEIAGYRDVLATIHASYPHIAVSPNTIDRSCARRSSRHLEKTTIGSLRLHRAVS